LARLSDFRNSFEQAEDIVRKFEIYNSDLRPLLNELAAKYRESLDDHSLVQIESLERATIAHEALLTSIKSISQASKETDLIVATSNLYSRLTELSEILEEQASDLSTGRKA
jgi:hypothetical protein